MRSLVVLLFAVLVGRPAWAWREPTGWVINWGESEQILMKGLRARCFDVDDVGLPSRACSFDFTRLGFPIKTVWRFRAGGLVAVHMRLSSFRFGEMKDVLLQDYGGPTQEVVELGTTPAGLPYQNTVVRWHGDRVQMNLQEHPRGWLSDAEVLIILTDEMERQYR